MPVDSVFLTDTRVYIAGVLMPVIDVEITNVAGAPPEARITLPADKRLVYIGENDRVPVLIFQRESMVNSSKFLLIFEGFIADRLYLNTALQRTITFRADGIMDILHDVRLMYMRTIGDLYRQTGQGNEERGKTSSASFFDVRFFFLQGLKSGGETIKYPYQYLENVLQYMGDPAPGEGSTAKEHKSMLSRYYRKMHSLYNMMHRYLRVPLYDESNSSVWYGGKENGFPILKGMTKSTTVDLLSPFIATQTPDSQTLWDLLSMVANPMDYEVSMPAAPAYIGGRVGSVIFKPNFYDTIPPRCNVIYRSQVQEIQQHAGFKGMPTRIQVHDPNSPVNQFINKETSDLRQYFEQLLTNFYPQREVPPELVQSSIYNKFATTLLETENYTGPWVHRVDTPKWYLWTDVIPKDEQTTEKGPKEAWVGARQMLAHRSLVLARYLRRTLSVTTVFNPYVTPGYPAVVFDAEDTGLSFAGYVTAVSHSISPLDMHTNIQLSFVRPLDEAAAFQIVHPVHSLNALLWDKSKMSQVYAGLLGSNEPAAPVASPSVPAQAAGASNAPVPGAPLGPLPSSGNDVVDRSRLLCNNDRYIYSQEGRLKQNADGTFNLDCSSFVSVAIGANDPDLCTANMRQRMARYGYEWIPSTADLRPGDIIHYQAGDSYIDKHGRTARHKHGHTEVYTGNGFVAGAHGKYKELPDGRVVERPRAEQVNEKRIGDTYIRKTYAGVFRLKQSVTPQQQQQQQQQPANPSAAQNTPQQAQQSPTPSEQAQLEQQKKEAEDKKKAEAAAQAGKNATEQQANNIEFTGAEAMPFQELLDLYSVGTTDRASPQVSIAAAYAMQRRNICTFDQFVSFAKLTPVLGTPVANEVVPVRLDGEYMEDRNKVTIFEKTFVQKAAENKDTQEKEQKAEQPAANEQKQEEPKKADEAAKAAAQAEAGQGQAPAQPQAQQQANNEDWRGSLSRKYESGGKSSAVGFISGDKGRTSFGKYQMVTGVYGTFPKFLNWAKNKGAAGAEVHDRIYQAAKGDKANLDDRGVGAVSKEWKALAAEGKLGNLEHEFIKEEFYDVALRGIRSEEVHSFVQQSMTLQDVVWSTAVAHGPYWGNGIGAPALLEKAYNVAKSKALDGKVTHEAFIEELYEERKKHYTEENNIKAKMAKRYNDEKADALAAEKREKDTGVYSIPNANSRGVGRPSSAKYYDGGMSGEGAYSGGPLNPARDLIEQNPYHKYTFTEMFVADGKYKLDSFRVNIRDVLEAVAKDAFSKQIYE